MNILIEVRYLFNDGQRHLFGPGIISLGQFNSVKQLEIETEGLKVYYICRTEARKGNPKKGKVSSEMKNQQAEESIRVN